MQMLVMNDFKKDDILMLIEALHNLLISYWQSY